MALCRELTKKYETVLRMKISQVLDYYREHPVRGVRARHRRQQSPGTEKEKQESWGKVPLNSIWKFKNKSENLGKEAMKLVARDRG